MINWMRTGLLLVALMGLNHAADTISTTKPTTPTTNATTSKVEKDSKIVGGVAVSINDFPFQVSLRASGSHFCGGSIVNKDWVVTAAHCTYIPLDIITVKAGSATRSGSSGTVHSVTQMLRHPFWNNANLNFDVAVLKVSPPFNFALAGIKPIVLAGLLPLVFDGTIATVSGWGYLVGGGTVLPDALQAVNVPIVNQLRCMAIFANSQYPINLSKICAGGSPAGGTAVCNGDSGGPLTVKVNGIKQLVGIVSYASPCAKPNIPDVYARVSMSRIWIILATLSGSG